MFIFRLIFGPSTTRSLAALALVALLSVSVAPPVRAGAESREQAYPLDIARLPRAKALQELSRQAHLLLGYLPNSSEEEQALVGPLQGDYSVEGALNELLKDSALTYRWVDQEMISVEPVIPAENGSSEHRYAAIPTPNVTVQTVPEPTRRETVMVVAPAIHDVIFSTAPQVVIDRDRIRATGASSVPELMRYISQSAVQRPEGYSASGAQYAEMRGFGADTALVLINGRRTMPSANSVSSSAFDLNTVPITAVDRIELLLDSAAAVYGTDAIGGVINIVLREKVVEDSAELRYGFAEGGAEQYRATITAGWEGEQLQIASVADYFELGGLLGAERDRFNNQDFRRFGGTDQRSLSASAGNIRSLTGANLPGLSSPFAAVPLVDPTPGSISREDFIDTAGQENRESLFRYWSVVPESRRVSSATTLNYDFNESLAMSAELLYVNRDSYYYFAPPFLPGFPVPAGNAFNPFGTPLQVNLLMQGMKPRSQYVESDLLRGVTSLHGGLGKWTWELSLLHSDEKARTWINNEIDYVKLMSGLASSDRRTALNPFQNGPLASPEILAGLLAPRRVEQFSSAGTRVAGLLAGNIVELRGGPIATILGVEGRNESTEFTDVPGTVDRDVYSAFAQVRVPLVSSSMNWRGVHGLTVSAASRMDDYSDMGEVTLQQFGMNWMPHQNVTVRVSRGRSFRPASLYELRLPQISTPSVIMDPQRGNEIAAITQLGGGNELLEPSRALSTTAGIVFSTGGPNNWLFSADYWRVKMGNRVATLTAPVLLANEERFPDRVLRAAPTQADQSAGQPGRLLSINTTRINAGRATASGVDFKLGATVDTGFGRFVPELQATWFDEFSVADFVGAPVFDRVNLANELGSILEWRAIFMLGWSQGPFGINTSARFTPSYDDAVGGVRTGRRVASQTLFDLQGTLDLGQLSGSSLWKGFNFSVGAMNLFDEEPSFAEVGSASGFDQSQGDLKQRSFYIRLDRNFDF